MIKPQTVHLESLIQIVVKMRKTSKDKKKSADITKKQPQCLSSKIGTPVQPIFSARKIGVSSPEL